MRLAWEVIQANTIAFEIWNFKTKDLRKHIKRFADIAGYETERVREDQVEVSLSQMLGRLTTGSSRDVNLWSPLLSDFSSFPSLGV